ncbi:MAG: DUF2259 domain-containing protein [Hyphomicrobiales bacterium]|nr:DUF2259 domain-containing protein [Hyphomicrobiales bacterium]
MTAVSKSIALAGDYASHEVIGFSPDGEFFAFEQYGVQDGSGFPYSEIFLIDTENDRWVAGSPVRILLDDEAETLDKARQEAKDKAASLLKRHRISDAGEHLASNPRAELSADPHKITVNTAHQMTPPAKEPVRFTLSETPFDSPKCSTFADTVKGFALTMSRSGNETILHEDERVPESRNCPLGYAFSDVYRHFSGDGETFAILLHMHQVGFEGPDGRFLAITARLP